VEEIKEAITLCQEKGVGFHILKEENSHLRSEGGKFGVFERGEKFEIEKEVEAILLKLTERTPTRLTQFRRETQILANRKEGKKLNTKRKETRRG